MSTVCTGADDDDEGWKGCLCAVLHLGALHRAIFLVINKKWRRLDTELRFELAEVITSREGGEQEPVKDVHDSDNVIIEPVP